MGIYGQYHERYCFVTLAFKFKVTGGLLKGQILAIFHILAQFSWLDHPMAGIYNTYICPLYACRNLPFKLFIEGHQQTAKVPDRGHFFAFFEIFSRIADYIAWKLLKMALEVEYMMGYPDPGLLVTEDC